jgi:hypothetical protein
VIASGLRPCLRGGLRVDGAPGLEGAARGELAIDGLLIGGSLTVAPAGLSRLSLSHVTLLPTLGRLRVEGENETLELRLRRCICGPIDLSAAVPFLSIDDSVVDGAEGTAIAAPGSDLRLRACTVFGTTGGRSLHAADCIFSQPLSIERRQFGGITTSYVPPRSRVPPCHRCQPEPSRAADARSDEPAPAPLFASRRYGDPAYAQLRPTPSLELGSGAANDGEMGAFNFLIQPAREAGLRRVVREFLPLGLEAGVYYVT